MSNEEQPPAWAAALLHRLTELEARVPSNTPRSDPNVVVRAPGADFTPPAAMLEKYDFIEQDFFRRPMDEAARRRFLFECPKNTLRNYNPPKLNKVSLGPDFKQFDYQLYDIQYRLSGLTRPMDWFLYQMSFANWSPSQLHQQSQDFVHSMHELLSDLASTITNLRTKNFYKGLPSKSDPPPVTSEDYLVEPKDMLEHLKLHQQVQQATQQRKRKNRPRPKHANDGNTAPAQSNNTGPTGRATNNNASNLASTNPAPQPSVSSGFQQRPQQKRHL